MDDAAERGSSSTGELQLSAALLQHSSMREPEVTLALLATSKSVQRMLHEHGRGCIRVEFNGPTVERAQQFAAWLAKHAHLLGTLHMWFYEPPSQPQQLVDGIEAALTTGLKQANQQQRQQNEQHGLCLQEFVTYFAGSSADALLQQLPCSVTQLSLSNDQVVDAAPCSIGSSTLAAFTQLRHLFLDLHAGCLEPLLGGLHALKQLRELHVDLWGSNNEMLSLQRHMPEQLQQLTLLRRGVHSEGDAVWLPLELTQLTGLHTLVVQDIPVGSRLPTHLRSLSCSRCPSAQPLLGMCQLQQLDMSCNNTPASELQQLGSLTSLSDISLHYSNGDTASTVSNAAAGWPAIASRVKHLMMVFHDRNALAMPHTALQQISCLTAVTSLVIKMGEGPMQATAEQLAGILQNLKQLNRLEVYNDETEAPLVLMDQAAVAAEAAAQQAAAAAAQAQQLAAQQAAAQQAAAAAAAVAQQAAAEAQQVAAAAALAAQQIVAAAAAPPPPAAAAAAYGAAPPAAPAAADGAAPPAAPAAAAAAVAAAVQDAAAGVAAAPAPVPWQGAMAWDDAFWQDPDESNSEDEPAGDDPFAGELAEQLVPVTHAIATLPQLVSLKLKGAGMTVEAVEQLTSMTRLTRLTISGLGFGDAALNSIACSLMGLQRLSLSDAEITDAPLMAVAMMLQQLTEIELANCGNVTDTGVRWLARLSCLQCVDVGADSGIPTDAVDMALRRVTQA